MCDDNTIEGGCRQDRCRAGPAEAAELLGLLRPCFVRVGPWLQAGKCAAALMSQMPRRNGWTIAEQAGDRAPAKTQWLPLGDPLRRERLQGEHAGMRGRGWAPPATAIARHTVLVMAALAICAVTAALLRRRTSTQTSAPARPDQPPPTDPGMTPVGGGERELLGQYLDFQRATILAKTDGLDREQMARRHPPSELSLAGLLYHLALVEEAWMEKRFLDL